MVHDAHVLTLHPSNMMYHTRQMVRGVHVRNRC